MLTYAERNRAMNEAQNVYRLFKIATHVLASLAWLVLFATQFFTANIVWASLICSPLIVIHHLSVRFFGWAASILFFVLFILLTFSLTSYNIKANAVGEYAVQHGYSIPKHGRITNAGYALKDDLRNQWSGCSDYYYWTKEGIDVWAAFDGEWAKFEQWVYDGQKGENPMPTPKHLDQFILYNRDVYKMKAN